MTEPTDKAELRQDTPDRRAFTLPVPERAKALDEARALTCGDRREAYGDPVLNHQHIADIFNAITGRDLSAREIVLVHQATKLARRSNNPTHRDSFVDGAAYTAIELECALAEAKAAAQDSGQ